MIARAGSGRRLLLNSHYDTVPATDKWTRDPWEASVEDGQVFGLGSNDAKASVAAMTAAFLEHADRGGPGEVALVIVCEEETGGEGTEVAWPHLRDANWVPDGVVVGEPTNLQIAIAQKGLMILELVAEGDGGHAANVAITGARNAVTAIAHDLAGLDGLDLGPPHPLLGSTSLQPTRLQGGEARNMVPVQATCVLDLRTVPGLSHEELRGRVQAHVQSEVRVISDRLGARECASDAEVVSAARLARPQAELFGASTMADLVFFEGGPAIKCGPGRSERSHQPDEFVRESEILEGAAFYTRLIQEFMRG